MKKSLREKLNISRLAIKYRRVTLFFWIAVTIAGLLSFSSLKYALFPDVPFPVVIVQSTADFDTAEETETKLTGPLEQSLKSLERAELFSSTYPGQTIVSVAFEGGLRLDQSTEAVKDALEQASLPPGATLEVTPFSLNESAAVSYAIGSQNQPLEELANIARSQIIPPLEKLSGVGRVELLGDANFRPTDNNNTPTSNPSSLVRFNGEDMLSVRVVKKADANTLEVVAEVERFIAKLTETLPDVQLILAETQAKYIKQASRSTIEALIGAIVLAILVIFPFLRDLQATLITALAIPISLLGTSIFIAIVGFNLETLTLLALALVIGIIVDDAIVDVENIARHINDGKSSQQAAVEGTDEIGLTVTASTVTIAAVFIPISLIEGNLGHFFRPFGLTVAVAVLISLSVARTLSPVLAVYWMKSKRQKVQKTKPFFLSLPYRNLLNWSLNHRKKVIMIALASLILGASLVNFIPKGFLPKLDRGEFNIVYSLPIPKIPERLRNNKSNDSSLFGNLAQSPERFFLRVNRRVAQRFEEIVLEDSNVESTYTIVGLRGDPLRGKIYVKLKDDRQLTTNQVQEKIRGSLPQIKRTTVSIEDILFVETGDDTPLKVAFIGNNIQSLYKTVQEIKSRVEKLPGLVDVKVSSGDENNLFIEHFQGERVVYLTANLQESVGLGDITDQVIEISESILPPDISLDVQGSSAQVRKIFGEFGIAITISILVMMAVLYIPFGRLLEPLVVVLSLPLSLVGAMFALLITQSDFGMISLIGFIFLLGLLDKNAVLLMDYINQLREEGMSRHDAILKTGEVRIRPIIMTTTSTILGMLPIALGLGAGAELRQPMAVAIIGGLITSSLLSLIVVPVLYTILEDWLSKKSKINL